MKLVLAILMFLSSVFVISAQQLDNENNSIVIEAEETNDENADDSIDIKPFEAPEKEDNDGMIMPKLDHKVDIPEKQFSMFEEEEFGNPAELYTKTIDRAAKMPKHLEVDKNVSREDVFYGEYKTKSDELTIVYRDFGNVDGDVIRIFLNDDVRKSNVYLQSGYKGFKYKFQEGLGCKIDFQAMNVGGIAPNTAEFKILDKEGNVIATNQWNMLAGVKATIVIVNE